MARSVLRAVVFLAVVAISAATLQYRPRNQLQPHGVDEEFIRRIHSMMDAYRGKVGGYEMESDAVAPDTKYRAGKRNADFINAILALPKGMNDAGR